MFLRRHRRKHRGELYEYWTLVECVRTARGPRQRVVATLGKLPCLDQEEQRGWEEIERLMEGREVGRQTELFEPGSPELSSAPQWGFARLTSGTRSGVWECLSGFVALATFGITQAAWGIDRVGSPKHC